MRKHAEGLQREMIVFLALLRGVHRSQTKEPGSRYRANSDVGKHSRRKPWAVQKHVGPGRCLVMSSKSQSGVTGKRFNRCRDVSTRGCKVRGVSGAGSAPLMSQRYGETPVERATITSEWEGNDAREAVTALVINRPHQNVQHGWQLDCTAPVLS